MLKRLLASLRAAPTAPPAPVAPDAGALNDAGIAAWRRGDLAAAEQALRAALRAQPGNAAAHANLGIVLWERGCREEGLACLQAAVALDPAAPGLHVNLGNALAIGNRMEEAIAAYREALRLRPHHARALAGVAKPLLDVCDWHGAEKFAAELVARWHEGDAAASDAITPFASLLYDLPDALRGDVARRHAERVLARAAAMRRPQRPPSCAAGRLRIGYVSADFHDHATAHLAVGLFEHHDRDRFEVHAYSFGPDDGSACRRRVVAAFEHFHELRAASAQAIAERIAADGIDILVDLKGYTTDSRPEIFALRAAPVQVSWLGYPGTMAAPFIDYIVADAQVLPAGADAHYAERVVRLPHSYQPNDDRQVIDPVAPSRAACQLPPEGVVFACFNKHHKIGRGIFDAWLGILRAVPGSVLWLLGGHGEAALRRAAHAQGVDPARLVFASKLPKSAHLARHRHADLFLDTPIYNAHTTAADALWAGVPVLTFPGRSFAARVGTSLAHAVGLPELAVADLDAYVREAIALARDPARLAGLRARLAASRPRAPLFDTAGFARDLESAFAAMQERCVRGEAPAPIRIRPRASARTSTAGRAPL